MFDLCHIVLISLFAFSVHFSLFLLLLKVLCKLILFPILFLYFQYILTKIYILHQNVVDSLPLQHQVPR